MPIVILRLKTLSIKVHPEVWTNLWELQNEVNYMKSVAMRDVPLKKLRIMANGTGQIITVLYPGKAEVSSTQVILNMLKLLYKSAMTSDQKCHDAWSWTRCLS